MNKERSTITTQINSLQKTISKKQDSRERTSNVQLKNLEKELTKIQSSVDDFYNTTKQQLSSTNSTGDELDEQNDGDGVVHNTLPSASETQSLNIVPSTKDDMSNYIPLGKKTKLRPSNGIIRSLFTVNHLKLLSNRKQKKNSLLVFSEKRQ
jgi:septal ring factor EnvC (AmiA/AmiB activator)